MIEHIKTGQSAQVKADNNAQVRATVDTFIAGLEAQDRAAAGTQS